MPGSSPEGRASPAPTRGTGARAAPFFAALRHRNPHVPPIHETRTGSRRVISPDERSARPCARRTRLFRSEEHTSELQSLMRKSYADFCLKTKNKQQQKSTKPNTINKHNTHTT